MAQSQIETSHIRGRSHRVLLFLSQPIRAFFAPQLYADVAKAPYRSALAYVLYLGIISGILAATLLTVSVLRKLDDRARWIAPRLPELAFTAEGVVSPVLQPYEVREGNQVLLHLDTTREHPPASQLGERLGLRTLMVIGRSTLTINFPVASIPPQTYTLTPGTPEEKATWRTYHLDCCEFLRSYRWYRTLAQLAAFSVPTLTVSSLTLALSVVLSTFAWPLCLIAHSRTSWRALWNMSARASTAALIVLALAVSGVLPRASLTALSLFLIPASYLALGVRWAR